jgi:hypothetical protein
LHVVLLLVERGVLLLVALAAQRLPRQIVAAGLDRGGGFAAPFRRQAPGLVELAAQLLLLGDHRQHRPPRFVDAGPHVAQNLVEHLFGVLRSVEEIVEIGADQPAQAVQHAHALYVLSVGVGPVAAGGPGTIGCQYHNPRRARGATQPALSRRDAVAGGVGLWDNAPLDASNGCRPTERSRWVKSSPRRLGCQTKSRRGPHCCG